MVVSCLVGEPRRVQLRDWRAQRQRWQDHQRFRVRQILDRQFGGDKIEDTPQRGQARKGASLLIEPLPPPHASGRRPGLPCTIAEGESLRAVDDVFAVLFARQ